MKKDLSFEELKEIEELKHKNRMCELEFERTTIQKRIDDEMGMLRLKTANMNRMMDKKDYLREKWFKLKNGEVDE